MNGQDPASEKLTRAVIGLAMIAGAVVLLFFSAPPTLLCTRGASPGVDCEIHARALNLIPIRDERVRRVRSVTLVDSRATSSSDTPARLIFLTDGSARDLGYFSQRFAEDWRALDQFARRSESPEIRLTRKLGMQTIAAHLTAFFFLAVGGAMILSAFRIHAGREP